MYNTSLPLCSFQGGENITLPIWVSANTHPLLTNTIKLSADCSGFSYFFSYNSGNIISQVKLHAGNIGFGCNLVIATSTKNPQGNYTATVIGTDNFGVEHQDSSSFSNSLLNALVIR